MPFSERAVAGGGRLQSAAIDFCGATDLYGECDAAMGFSIIQDMAESFYVASYRGAPPIVDWRSLSAQDRVRIIDAMEAAVKSIPDCVVLKRGFYAVNFRLDQTREVILSDHDTAKKSAMYER